MLSEFSVASCAAGSTAGYAVVPPVGLPVYEISRGVCMGRDVRNFMRMGMSFLLAMCKNRHAARILEINSTNARFFITNTLSGEPVRTFFLTFSAQDASARVLCADRPCCVPTVRAVCRPSVLHDGPPRQYPAARKNLPAIAGRSGIKASGLPDISGGLVYPFEIVDVHLVGRAAVHKIAVGACCTRNNQLIVFARFCFFIIVVDFQFRFDHAVAFCRLIDE